MRLLVCGSRGWTNEPLLRNVLDRTWERWPMEPFTTVVEGEQEGADLMGRAWAEARGIFVDPYPAHWERYGKSAGHVRNQKMLDSGVDVVAAFSTTDPATPGTQDMCRRAYAARVLAIVFVTADGRERMIWPRVDALRVAA